MTKLFQKIQKVVWQYCLMLFFVLFPMFAIADTGDGALFGWLSQLSGFWTVLSSIVTTASIIVAFTPSKSDDKWWAKIKPYFDWLALNIFNAKK